MREGFVYYSIGDECIGEAIASIKSLLCHMPGSAVTVFTDRPDMFVHLGVNTVQAPTAHSKVTRAQLLQRAPYEKTFYIDSDTLFIDGCHEIFDYLDHGDMCLSLSNLTSDDGSRIPTDFPFYNCGIIGYKPNAHTLELLNDWEQEIANRLKTDRHAKDEPAFREVVYQSRCPITLLPNQYNFRPQNTEDLHVLSGIKIIHCHNAARYIDATEPLRANRI